MDQKDLKTIIILWMDDREETYPDVQTSIRDGVLHIFQYHAPRGDLLQEWHWALGNIRGWWPAHQDPPQWAKG